MENTHILTLFILLAFIFILTSAQAPAAAPAPPPPTNLTKILEKAGQFTTFIRLLDNTKVGDQIDTQLNNSNQGMTIFAPTDNAFSGLSPGMLNSFSDQQKVELIQFHVLPSFYSTSQFQTASNPLRTQAGGSEGAFPLNVTASGNSVNITTGVTNTTLANTIYSDHQLAIYQVDKVLLPQSFFSSPAPAQAPMKGKKGAKAPASSTGSDDSTPADTSASAIGMSKHVFGVKEFVVLVLAMFL